MAKLQRFFGGEQKNNHVILCDEAHNLVDRAREMYSAQLTLRELNDAGKALRKGVPKLYRQIRKMAGYLKEEQGRWKEEFQKDDAAHPPREIATPFPTELPYGL